MAPRRCSITSIFPSTRTPRSAFSAPTARASRRSCASWRGSTRVQGEAWLAEGATVGYLAQEPQLDPAKTVFENVMEGVKKKTAIVERYNELMMNYSDETADESAKLQDEMDRLNLWDLERRVEMAMDALQCPPGDADVNNLSGGERRRVALCRLLLEQPDPPSATARLAQPLIRFLQIFGKIRGQRSFCGRPAVVRLTLAYPLLAVKALAACHNTSSVRGNRALRRRRHGKIVSRPVLDRRREIGSKFHLAAVMVHFELTV